MRTLAEPELTGNLSRHRTCLVAPVFVATTESSPACRGARHRADVPQCAVSLAPAFSVLDPPPKSVPKRSKIVPIVTATTLLVGRPNVRSLRAPRGRRQSICRRGRARDDGDEMLRYCQIPEVRHPAPRPPPPPAIRALRRALPARLTPPPQPARPTFGARSPRPRRRQRAKQLSASSCCHTRQCHARHGWSRVLLSTRMGGRVPCAAFDSRALDRRARCTAAVASSLLTPPQRLKRPSSERARTSATPVAPCSP